jgi:hypothetical protein
MTDTGRFTRNHYLPESCVIVAGRRLAKTLLLCRHDKSRRSVLPVNNAQYTPGKVGVKHFCDPAAKFSIQRVTQSAVAASVDAMRQPAIRAPHLPFAVGRLGGSLALPRGGGMTLARKKPIAAKSTKKARKIWRSSAVAG